MVKKILGKAALKAKRQAAKDAVKRSKRKVGVKEGTIIGESKFIDDSKKVLKEYKNKRIRKEKRYWYKKIWRF